MSKDAPADVKRCLDDLAARLWANKAAVMVGAGYSRNASAEFPTWEGLGDRFYEKLHGRPPGPKAKYLDILKLAGQVEAVFERPALHVLLRQAIPDRPPSLLHSRLLGLPWKDVFTTNYDELLEQALPAVPLKHYTVVKAEKDIPGAEGARIVKLHGSLPEGPFVITEEDYRRYPLDHDPFVNTVRQSLLENKLCLIGFSADDPNFLQWLGWIRDHIGTKEAPRIYLVALNRLGKADNELLHHRGIIPIDLSWVASDRERREEEALNWFLQELEERKPRVSEWPRVSPEAQPWSRQSDRDRYREVVEEWRRQRLDYPGWVVAPTEGRLQLWLHTQHWLSHLAGLSNADRQALEPPLDLDLAFELAWRLDRCLLPLRVLGVGNLSALMEEVEHKYGNASPALLEKVGREETCVAGAVFEIRLWLLRHYREQGLNKEWDALRKTLGASVNGISPERKARFRLEAALQALFRFDPAEAKRLLTDEWPCNEATPFWDAKRAVLLAELEEEQDAQPALEASLAAIRRQQRQNRTADDYTLVSQESVVMLLYQKLDSGLSRREEGPKDLGGIDLRDLTERQNELARYNCTPHREEELLSARVRSVPPTPWSARVETPAFDTGLVSRSYRFGPDEEVLSAYRLLRMYEDIGMPYRIGHTTFADAWVEGALRRMGTLSPHWALVAIARLGNEKATDCLFNREYLAGLTQSEVDGYCDTYLGALDRIVSTFAREDPSEAGIFEQLARTLPEVFSRLCYKCSPEYRKRLVKVLGPIYGSPLRWRLVFNIPRFVRRLLESMSTEELARAIPALIGLPQPLPKEPGGVIPLGERDHPLLFVKLPKPVRLGLPGLQAGQIDKFFERMAGPTPSPDRDWATAALVWLHDNDQLDEERSKRLGNSLWEGVKAPQVPDVPGHNACICLKLPHPADIDPEPLVKQHLRSKIPQWGSTIPDNSMDELRNSAWWVNWSWSEAMELLAEVSNWWRINKHRMKDNEPTPFVGSPAEHTRKIISGAVGALSSIFARLPAVDDDDNLPDALRAFIADLEGHGIPTLRLEAATLKVVPERLQRVLERVKVALLDADCDIAFDALSATDFLAHMLPEDRRDRFAGVATTLVEGIRWRHRPALAVRLRCTAGLVRKQPWFLSKSVKCGLLAGLRHISEETIQSRITGNDGDGLISIRASAAALAFALAKCYGKWWNEEPESIGRWRDICGDPDEFAEVRNAWTML